MLSRQVCLVNSTSKAWNSMLGLVVIMEECKAGLWIGKGEAPVVEVLYHQAVALLVGP
jgi:hypothetical protein